MIKKEIEKQKAISMRKKGLSYSEILAEIHVAKSSLSLWLRSVGLSKRLRYRLSEKKRISQLKGAWSRHLQRVRMTEKIFRETEKEIGDISRRELWLMGIMLYWAEGSKEKLEYPGSGIRFSNSDPDMINLFLKWLFEICGISKDDIKFEIYIHENSLNNLDKIKMYWSKSTRFSIEKFNTVYFKRNKIKTNRKNIHSLYYGLLRINVKASSTLNRKIAGWVRGVNKTLPGGVFGNTPAFEAGDTRFEP